MGRKHNIECFLNPKVGNILSKIVDIQAVFFISGIEESPFNIKYYVVLYTGIKNKFVLLLCEGNVFRTVLVIFWPPKL
jgi:hypothetical protein